MIVKHLIIPMKVNKIILIVVILALSATACSGRNRIASGPGRTECTADSTLSSLITELKQLTQRINVLFSKMFSFEQGSSERETIEEEYEILRQRHKQIIDQIIGIGPTVIPCMIELVKDDSIEIAIRIDAVIVLGEVSKDQNNEIVILTLLEKLPFTERAASIAVMGALFNIGRPAIPYVIAQLNNESIDKRTWAYELLRIMTAQTFDFYDRKHGDDGLRRQAVDKIREWWKQNELTWKRPDSKD